MFNCADGLPVPVGYREYDPTDDLTGSQLETGFPGCDYEAMQAAKNAYQPVQEQLDVLEAEYNRLVAVSQGEEVQRFIDYTGGYYKEVVVNRDSPIPRERGTRITWIPPVVRQGWLVVSGPDVKLPLPPEGEGWSMRKGEKVFDASDVEIPKYANEEPQRAEVYVLEWYRPTGTVPSEELEAKRLEIEAKEEELKPLYEAYIAELNKCGFNRPGDEQTRASLSEIIDSSVPPKYFEHNASMQLKTLAVGDTIFVVNPLTPVSMLVGSARPQRPNENFIELRTIAPAKEYAVELTTPETTTSSYTTVTSVSVNDAKFQEDGENGCLLGGTQIVSPLLVLMVVRT